MPNGFTALANLRLPSFLLVFVLVVAALLLWLAPLVGYADLTWHDQQRLAQIVLSLLVFFGLFGLCVKSDCALLPVWIWTGAGVLVLGFVSSVFSAYPLWAMTELALFVCCIGIGAFVFSLAGAFSKQSDFALGVFIRVLLGGMVLQFYVTYIAIFAHSDLYFTPWMLLYGFSNPRHQGQFLTIVVPLLGAALFSSGVWRSRYPEWLDKFLVVSLSCIVFVAGTRGTIVAWFAVALLFFVIGGTARKLSRQVLVALILGLILSWAMLYVAALVTNQVAALRELSFGLSAREIIWEEAWVATKAHPWFGVGPMHFASLKSKVASHPHQALLQLTSEWGIPAFLFMATAVILWLWRAYGIARSQEGTENSVIQWCILFSLTSSLVQSMVDGVLVMPYPQVWLAITVGWGCAKFTGPLLGKAYKVPCTLLLLLLGIAVAWLVWVAIVAYPDLLGASEYCAYGPRFWCDGPLSHWPAMDR
jgi:O-antigen ligase